MSDFTDNPHGLEDDLDAISTDAEAAMEALERDDTDTARQLLRGIKAYADRWKDTDDE